MNSALYATAKQRINDFCQREYEGHAVFTDMAKINIAYTTTEDARYDVQAAHCKMKLKQKNVQRDDSVVELS